MQRSQDEAERVCSANQARTVVGAGPGGEGLDKKGRKQGSMGHTRAEFVGRSAGQPLIRRGVAGTKRTTGTPRSSRAMAHMQMQQSSVWEPGREGGSRTSQASCYDACSRHGHVRERRAEVTTRVWGAQRSAAQARGDERSCARARDRPIHAAAAFFAMRCAAAGSPSSLAATVPSCAPLHPPTSTHTCSRLPVAWPSRER